MSCKKIKYISAFFLLVLCQHAFAWEKFKAYEVWIDKDSIYSTNKKGNKFVHIWAMWNTSLPNGQDVKSVKSLLNIDCKGHYVDTDSFYYSQLQGRGEKLSSGYWAGNIEPESLYSDLFIEYCKDWWQFW